MIGKIYTLGDVATYINGRAFKPAEWETTGLPIVRIQNLTDRTAPCNRSTNKFEDKFLLKDGDLLFAWAASLGVHIWQGGPAWLNQHIFKVIPNEGIEKKYLYFYLLYTISDLYRKAHGSGMVHITKGPFLATKIPLPSLTEQQRIVAKIEELFSELDNGIATLKRAKEQLSVYRQAVLKEYIEGSYNAKCNKYIRIKDFAKVGTGATPLKTCPKYYGGSIPWISSSKINEIKITTPSDYITDIALKETNCKLYPPHTILIAMYGEGKTRGKCAELMISAATNQALAAIELSNNSVITKDFLMAFLELNYQQLRRKASGGVQPNLNLSIIKDLKVPRYSLEEQKKIVFSIEYRFSHCSAIEKAVERSIRQAESLRQSILKQAFEGKLV